MSGVELKANDVLKGSNVATAPAIKRRSVLSSFTSLPVLVTVAAVCVAAVLGWAAWQYYMGSPWTRDGTVRAYVVKIAPEVAGQIVQLPIADNQFVHKGDLLMLIDPRNYSIAVRQAEATVEQTRAISENAQRRNDAAIEAQRHRGHHGGAADLCQPGGHRRGELPVGAREPRAGARQSQAHAGPLTGQRLCHQSYRPARRLCQCRGPPAFRRQFQLVLGRRLFRGDRSRAASTKATPRRSSSWDTPPCCAAEFRGSRAASMSPTPRRTPPASPRSIRSSPSCASPSACRYAFTSMRFQKGSKLVAGLTATVQVEPYQAPPISEFEAFFRQGEPSRAATSST